MRHISLNGNDTKDKNGASNNDNFIFGERAHGTSGKSMCQHN